MPDVASTILARRLALGLSQAELARRALLPRPNLSAIESGRRDLTVGTLVRIARALGVGPATLLGPAAEPSPRLGMPVDTLADAVLTGRRGFGRDLDRLADGLAWRASPSLAACGVPGARHASRRAWITSRSVWHRTLLDHLEAKVRKFLASEARRSAA